MFSIFSLIFFLSLALILFSNASHLLMCVILLETFTFLALWSLFSSPLPLIMPYGMLVFSMFVLEAVLGIIALLNFIQFFGSDYFKVSMFSMCFWN